MNVIFTCGGTGGHINPGIAVANILRERYPDSNILFVGGEGGMEEDLVPKAGYKIEALPCSSLRRGLSPKSIIHNIKGVGYVVSALKKSKKLIESFQPDVILGTGGYASFPALYMGTRMGIPTCVHEANAVPGLATRLVADRVDQILVTFAESAKGYKHPEKVRTVGMPVRREFIYSDRKSSRRELGLDERPLVISAFGSLGAREMNKKIADFLKLEVDEGIPFQHIHATGSFGWRWMPDLVKEKGVDLEHCDGLDMREYIYNMPQLMAAADLIISRAGSSSCNEIAAAGIPCILIPSPNVTDNHQEKNARILEGRGGCAVILESECTGQRLFDETKALLSDRPRWERMRQALLAGAIPNSAEQICDTIVKLARK